MGYVGDKFLPLVLAFLQGGGHIVKGQGQFLDFLGTVLVNGNPGVQMSVTEVAGSLCHFPQGGALPAGHQDDYDHRRRYHQYTDQ